MNQHNHSHGHQHDAHHAHPKSKGLHKDWRAWVVVLLMLAAIGMYVMSDDEALQPGENQPQQRMPAD